MELDSLRQQIDRIDGRIVPLLAERFAVVKEIGKEKKRLGLPLRVPEREAALLEKLKGLAAGTALPQEALEKIYRTIMDCAVAAEADGDAQNS